MNLKQGDIATGANQTSITSQLTTIDATADEIERHLHNRERWFGISADQSGDDWAVETGLTPFVLTSGNNAFGVAVKILGPDDTPAQAGMTKYDPHKLEIADLSNDTMFIIRLIEDMDDDGSATTAEGKGYYSDVMLEPTTTPATRFGGSSIPILARRMSVGNRLWAKCKNATNSATVEIYMGIHEYEE